MAGNIQALIRYRTIDRCLRRTHRRWTWRELSRACGAELRERLGDHIDDPSRRTIFTDIQNMRDGIFGYEAPITYDHGRKSFYYADPHFSISQIPLSREDRQELQHALVILKQFRGFHHLQGIESIIARLEQTSHGAAHPARRLIEFDHVTDSPGQQWLDLLYRYTFERQVLLITYHPFSVDEINTYPFSPYLLKEYNRRWFLIAYNHERDRLEKLALDRILDLRKSIQPFFQLPGFNPQNYFRDIVGVTLPEEGQAEEVLLRVSVKQAPYLDTKPLHASQELLEKSEEGWLFRLSLIPNYELESQLLSLGERVEVLAPEGLRRRIRERVRAMGERYE